MEVFYETLTLVVKSNRDIVQGGLKLRQFFWVREPQAARFRLQRGNCPVPVRLDCWDEWRKHDGKLHVSTLRGCAFSTLPSPQNHRRTSPSIQASCFAHREPREKCGRRATGPVVAGTNVRPGRRGRIGSDPRTPGPRNPSVSYRDTDRFSIGCWPNSSTGRWAHKELKTRKTSGPLEFFLAFFWVNGIQH